MFPENQEPFGSWERVFKEAGCSTPGGGKTNMCFELQASFTKLSMLAENGGASPTCQIMRTVNPTQ